MKKVIRLLVLVLGVFLISPIGVNAKEDTRKEVKKIEESIKQEKKKLKKKEKDFLEYDIPWQNSLIERNNLYRLLEDNDRKESLVDLTGENYIEEMVKSRRNKILEKEDLLILQHKKRDSEKDIFIEILENFVKNDEKEEKIDRIILLEYNLSRMESLYNDKVEELEKYKSSIKSLEKDLKKAIKKAEKREEEIRKEEERKKKEEERKRKEAARKAREEAARRAREEAARKSAKKTNPVKIITTSSGSAAGNKVSNFARSKIGGKYIWGGNGPNGYDCSGLTSAAYRSIGVSIPRTATEQSRRGRTVSYSNMRPGDLIFFGSPSNTYHVAMYVGNGQIVHASTPKTGIVITSVNNSWMRKNQYLVKRVIN